MWKVLVAICLMGQPCTLFVEDPIKYYHTEADCLVAAEAKSLSMRETFIGFGYYIESEAHACQYIIFEEEA